MTTEKILDLGCGARKTPGSFGVDQMPLEGVDVVHDLNRYPYPIESNSFDRIVLRHVAEHVDDVVKLMEEIHRIGRNGGTIEIHVPHFSSSNSYNDPTHKHHFSLLTFDFFCGGTAHGYLVRSEFRLKRRLIDFWPLHDKVPFVPYHLLGIRWFATHHPVLFERFFPFFFPIKEFTIELEVVK